ncbi:MAG TPA: M91 family zinc metallopeptidase [Nostocaceae cyanobacterium]|nr:M91 family zinc metallopeptidase [Nostocaceae cyanobacterium]
MYKAPQQRSQSRVPFTSPKTSSNQHTTGNFRVQPQLEYDSDGKEISFPVFILLGHELIHARHNAAGHSRLHLPATDSNYTNSEEEKTIATGSLTENDLRTEHKLPLRYGHQGRDTRPRILRN